MNLKIADGPGLVAFIHHVVRRNGATVLAVEGREVVRVDGSLFYHGTDPVEVGGPFGSLEALVRSEGLRRYVEPEGPEPRLEVFEWCGAFFRIEGGEVERYPSLGDAVGR